MDRNKVLELAREAELARQFALEVPFVVDRLERFATLVEREVLRGGMSRDKVFELMLTAGCSKYCDPKHPELEGFIVNDSVLDRIVALIEREVRGGAKPVAWMYTLEYGDTVADRKVSLNQLNYPFGVCGADYLRKNRDGISYVRQTPLYAKPVFVPNQRPVAWMCTETKIFYENDTSAVDKYHGFKPTVPLYTHPAPAVVRQPLTDDEINNLQLPESGTGTIRDLVRVVELAHGIGGSDE